MASLSKLNYNFGLAGIFAAIQAAILTNLTILVNGGEIMGRKWWERALRLPRYTPGTQRR